MKREKFDIVIVTTPYPGASPDEVETLVTRKIEDQVRTVSGVDRAESWSLENLSIVVLRLDEDLTQREKDKAVNDLYQAAQRVEDLPDLADKPIVQELTADRPLITLSVAGGTDDDRDRFAEELKDQVEELDGVSRVAFKGDREREVLVEVDRDKLARHRLTMGEVAAAIRGRNVDRSAGSTWSGTLENWDLAESALRKALERKGLPFEVDPGEGVFYGPKIDIKIKDMLGRSWQCSTIQVDFNNPERFDATYVADDGTPRRAIMIHRALMGSLERFFGVLVEHHAGAFPVWLAPVQADVVPVTEKQNAFAQEVVAALRAAGFRAEGDYRNEKLGYKIRESQVNKVPYALVVGEREAEAHIVSPRRRGGEQLPPMPIEAFIERLRGEAVNRTE